MLGFFLSPLGKLIGVGALAFAIGGASIGWGISTIYGARLDNLKAEYATQKAAANAAALARVEGWAKQMHDAASAYASSQTVLNDQIDAIQRDLHNVQIRHPLIAGCAPDAERVHSLNASVAASNAATAR